MIRWGDKMQNSSTTWNFILNKENNKAHNGIFSRLVETGAPLSPRPSFCRENEGLPYELIVTDESPLRVAGLMKFNAATAEWECLQVFPLSVDSPRSPWEVLETGVSPDEGAPEDKIEDEWLLMNESGRELRMKCRPLMTMKESLSPGRKFLCGISLIVRKLKKEESIIIVRDPDLLEAEKRRRKEENPSFEGEKLTFLRVDISHSRALLPGQGCLADFLTKVESVETFEFCGERGYRLGCALSPQGEAALPADLFVFPCVLDGYIPQVGDFISGFGEMAACPAEAWNDDTSWLDSPEVAQAQASRDLSREALAFIEAHPELPIAVRVIISSFIRTDWKILEVNSRYYSKMMPSFIAKKRGGGIYAVYVDSRMEGTYEYPDLNENELSEIRRRCKAQEIKDIRFRVNIIPAGESYSVSIAPSGKFPYKLSYLMDVPRPVRKGEEAPVVSRAAEDFARSVNESDLTALSFWLAEDLHFTSLTMGTDIKGKVTFLRYFSIALIRWAQRDVAPSARAGVVDWEGKTRPCLALMEGDKVAACTVFEARDGYVSRMITLPDSSVARVRLPESAEDKD